MHVWRGAMRVGCWTVAVAALGATVGVGLTHAESRRPRIVTVEMTATRFAFGPARVEVIEGDEVTFNVRSADGTHGIAIKTLKVKKEVPRGGEMVTLSVTAPAPGTYEIRCSEYCGRGHNDMNAALVVAPRGL